jgi:hypothetical protein
LRNDVCGGDAEDRPFFAHLLRGRSDYGLTRTLAVDANLVISRDNGASVLHSDRKIRTLSKAEITQGIESAQLGVIEFSWRALNWSGTELEIVSSGSYDLEATISLVELEIVDEEPVVVDTLDGVAIKGIGTIDPATAACLAWEAAAPNFVDAQSWTVKIAGTDTGVRPQVTWRANIATRVFGQLLAPTAGETHTQTVKRFVSTYEDLFGGPSTTSINALTLDEDDPALDDLRRVRLKQVVASSTLEVPFVPTCVRHPIRSILM